jgi:1-deoxy-D-xylulose-5-phosphate synthase
VEHASQADMYADAGLDRAGITTAALRALGYDEAAMAAAIGAMG